MSSNYIERGRGLAETPFGTIPACGILNEWVELELLKYGYQPVTIGHISVPDVANDIDFRMEEAIRSGKKYDIVPLDT
jgi:hypothetical protein